MRGWTRLSAKSLFLYIVYWAWFKSHAMLTNFWFFSFFSPLPLFKFPVHLAPCPNEPCDVLSNRKNKQTICCTSYSDKACHPCESLCDFLAWQLVWSFCYSDDTWMAFRLCEFACACASSSIGWKLCCKTDSETDDLRCESWCDREDAKICRRISRSAYTEIASVSVSFVPLVKTSAMRKTAGEIE